ncbi:MAG: glucosaminidase domain-containing protein [Rhodospirillales bacterium]
MPQKGTTQFMPAVSLSDVIDYVRRSIRNPWETGIVPGLVAAGFLLGLSIAGYKIYEHRVTGGVGFVEATELAGLDDVQVEEKKRQFFDALRPIIEAENGRIAELRKRLIAARDSGQDPSWVFGVAEDYDVTWTGHEWRVLLRRVDTIPMTLAMAQAANESSWGQSRFAQEGNNLFGQWCFTEGCGIVPEDRPAGDNHEVRAFGSINESVRSYLHNINTHRAYRELRQARARARAEGRAASGLELAGYLDSYSERGAKYIEEIRATVRVNRDLMLDAANQ